MKIRKRQTVAFLALAIWGQAPGAEPRISPNAGDTYWSVQAEGIAWNVSAEKRLPHSDHLEMSGRRVSAMVDYDVGVDRRITLRRKVIFPQLHVPVASGAPEWGKYRAYLSNTYTDSVLPEVSVGGRPYGLPPVETVEIDGMLKIVHVPHDGVQVERRLFPSMFERLFVETWKITNRTGSKLLVEVKPRNVTATVDGNLGRYRIGARTIAAAARSLAPGEVLDFALYFDAYLNDESEIATPMAEISDQRRRYVTEIKSRLVLQTPDPVLSRLFEFSKLRTAESIFESSMGPVQSPGGGNYYVGVWANDQAEYSGPFFPYLGYELGNDAALNAYRVFLHHIPKHGGKIFSSFEMDGKLPCCSKDRGDAAMLAYGASYYSLASGKVEVGRELWPLIEWGLAYSHSRLNDAGVVRSDSDEMEGRLPTGSANLATSCLYYAGLRQSATLARGLGMPEDLAIHYEKRATELDHAIERYFGARIGGLNTYRYFEGHTALRHWIGLPLAVGISKRRDDTVSALFEKMWTNNGVRVEWNPEGNSPELLWDRGTLYALRGAFVTGATELGLKRLREYSNTRLVGFHVPYPIEGWPENEMRHLSGESALYCRIYTEGLLGIKPTSFETFELTPRLPTEWRNGGYSLKNMALFGRELDIEVRPVAGSDGIAVRVIDNKVEIVDTVIGRGETISAKVRRR